MSHNSKGTNISLELVRRGQELKHAPALILNNQDISYELLDLLTWRAANHLFSEGVRVNDITGIFMKNEMFRLIYSLGLIRLGSTLVPIPRSLSRLQIDNLCKAANVKFILSDLTCNWGGLTAIIIRPSIPHLNGSSPINFSILAEEPDCFCILVSGSGSTGIPKIIPQTHAQLRNRVTLAFINSNSKNKERVASLTNLEFASGINRLLSVINAGAAMAIVDTPLSRIKDYCKEKGITTLFSSVFHLEQILNQQATHDSLIFDSLDSLRISGSTISLGLRQRVKRYISENLHIGYGANECGRISLSIPPRVFEDHFSVGKPLQGVDIKIIDKHNNTLENGERGQIIVKTPSVVEGYLNNHSATLRSFKDGWFYTGDLGQICEDGTIRHFGRVDNMMIVNGINIYPIEIEETIKELVGVIDVVAFPLKHHVHQDIPVCIVSLQKGSDLTPEYILHMARERLGFRAPWKVIIVNEIPRNENGKVQKSKLLEIINHLQSQ